MQFPLFRKYSGIETYFKVMSETSFEELKISEQFYSLNEFNAVNHFDRLFIGDIITKHENRWEEIAEKDYRNQVMYCESNLKRIA